MFFQIVSAVIVANAACGLGVVGLITARRLEKTGTPQDDLPLKVYAYILIPFAAALPGAIWLYTSI